MPKVRGPFCTPRAAQQFHQSISGRLFRRSKNDKKKHTFPEPSKNNEVGPNVAFIQGLILFVEPTFVESVPKMTILGSPSKSTFFKKGPLGGPGSAKKLIKSWYFEWPAHSVERPGRDLVLRFARVLIGLIKTSYFWDLSGHLLGGPKLF